MNKSLAKELVAITRLLVGTKTYNNAKELAKAFDVNENLIKEFVSKSEFPVLEGDKTWRYVKSELKDYEEERGNGQGDSGF